MSLLLDVLFLTGSETDSCDAFAMKLCLDHVLKVCQAASTKGMYLETEYNAFAGFCNSTESQNRQTTSEAAGSTSATMRTAKNMQATPVSSDDCKRKRHRGFAALERFEFTNHQDLCTALKLALCFQRFWLFQKNHALLNRRAQSSPSAQSSQSSQNAQTIVQDADAAFFVQPNIESNDKELKNCELQPSKRIRTDSDVTLHSAISAPVPMDISEKESREESRHEAHFAS